MRALCMYVEALLLLAFYTVALYLLQQLSVGRRESVLHRAWKGSMFDWSVPVFDWRVLVFDWKVPSHAEQLGRKALLGVEYLVERAQIATLRVARGGKLAPSEAGARHASK